MVNKDLIIVGIGASAGGLEALQGFVKELPTNTNFVYILAQHLSPTYKSLMVDLLSKSSTITVKEAIHQEEIEPDTMYICPPNKNIILEDNKLLLIEPKQLTYGPKPSINLLFESIANHEGNRSIGIILSGTGSDGSRGIRAIKAEGGFTIAQQPQNAKYDGMPNSAINTGNIDLILDVEVMGTEIQELLKYPNKAKSIHNLNEKTIVYQNILNRLKRTIKIDFSLYKPSTIQRRIERRMAALKITNIHDYNEYIAQNEVETQALFKDILIGVTAFFRDEEPFETLKFYLKELISKKKNNNIRIWIPGCSTGEEAYSIAMVLNDVLGNKVVDYKIQIFATDIDTEACTFARIARYPESALINVSEPYIKKYFILKNNEYEIIKPIRDMCIFSKHDISSDPAFMRLDLISCRNLLIYFTNELQQKIFPMFHYALNDDGLLFLGKSESIGNFNNYFNTLDKKEKIYKAVYIGQKNAPLPLRTFSNDPNKELKNINKEIIRSTPTISDMMVEHIQRHIMPICVVVNDKFDMIFIKGKNPYLVHAEGEITQNIFKNIRDELSVELRGGLHACKKECNLIKTQFIEITVDGDIKYVRMLIIPLDNSFTNDLFLITFQEEEKDHLRSYDISLKEIDDNEEIEKLKIELARTRQHLQTVIEELETSNEEMQSLNEELQSSNEELQSSNEELETTNEELQSTNEELQTAYTEMRAMYEERDNDNIRISTIKEDLENTNYRFKTLLESSKVGIFDYDLSNTNELFVDENWLNIMGYNISDLKDETNNILHWFETRIHNDDKMKNQKQFEDLLLNKIEKYTIDIRVLNKDNQYLWVRCFFVGIKDSNNKNIQRILGTLIDINDGKQERLEKEILKNKFTDAISVANLGVWEWNIQTDNLWWSDLMYEIYEIDKKTILNYDTVHSLVVEEDKERHEDIIKGALTGGIAPNMTYKIKTQKGIKYIWIRGSIIFNKDKKPMKIVGVVQDITKQKDKDLSLMQKDMLIDNLLENSFNGIYILNLNHASIVYTNPYFSKITGYSSEEIKDFSYDMFLTLVHNDDLDNFSKHINQLSKSENNKTLKIKYRFKHKNGTYINLSSNNFLTIKDKEREILTSFIEVKD